MSDSPHIVPIDDRPAIKPRLFSMPIAPGTPHYWLNDNAYATHFLNALSCIFPGGERFFMRTVRRYQNQVMEPRLKHDLRQFCGQEAIHGQQHEVYNNWTESFGYSMNLIAKNFEARMMRRSNRLPLIMQLALTVALEHFTAVLGNALLTSPKFLEEMHPAIRPLWIWHSIEEIEHKAVAFDVYTTVGGSYGHRMFGMFIAILGLLGNTIFLMSKLLRQDGQLVNGRAALRFMRLLHSSGYIQKVLLGLREYFRRDFHPWQIDDRALLQEFLPSIALYVPEQSRAARDIPA